MDSKLVGIIRAELNHINKPNARILKDTLAYNRDVVSFLIHVCCDHIDDIKREPDKAEHFIEHLVHKTKDNADPEYKTFDIIFNRFPSYMRRAAIRTAIGHVTSHETRCDQYYEARQKEIALGHHYKKMQPSFTYTPNSYPTLYKGQSFKADLSKGMVNIKTLHHGAWGWSVFSIPSRDVRYILNAMAKGGKLYNPKLVYEYHKFYLEFPVSYPAAEFSKTPLDKQIVLGVDIGFNNPAVCSVVDAYGSVHGRAFAPFRSEMARIDRIINRIRKHQKMSGTGQSLSALYTKLQGLKDNYVRQLAHWIVEAAIYSGAYGIVLEHLSSIHKGKKKRSLKARVHHWCVAKIRDYIKGLALRHGIRVFIINPNGTSRYAFDGSGKVVRDEVDYSQCVFANGKRYNCDLSASYNIAARYFLRAFCKSIPATEWSALKAKVPGLSSRTKWTLATLWQAAPAALRIMSASPSKACAA